MENKTTTKAIQLGVWCDPDLWLKMKEQAAQEKRTLRAVTERAFEAYLVGKDKANEAPRA